MAHVGLISCVKTKRSKAAQAKELYNSALFSKSRKFVERRCDPWFILSAKYGLVEPIEVIEPYEETLNKKSRRERHEWANRVWTVLRQRLSPDDRVTILAGIPYREVLVPLITAYGCQVDIPMEDLVFGRQLRWLNENE